MMELFDRIDIQELPLSVPSLRRKVEDFLGSNGLRLEEVDLYLAVLDADDRIIAGGGLQRDVIKCLAVSEAARSLGLSVPLVSRLISCAAGRGYAHVKVFTKPENRTVFESLGFRMLASAPQAILMENGRGLEAYCGYLRSHPASGVIVMNANPFTRGHRYLVEQAAAFPGWAEPERIVVIPVREDRSSFPYAERLEMIRRGSGDLADVVEGTDYQISAATFPTYFLKDLSDASETQMRLDIDLFGRHIAPALGARVRFVGREPADPLTARYNALMKELLPAYGVQVVEIPRLCDAEGPLTASRVRGLLYMGRYHAAAALTPSSTWPYLLAFLAERALRLELETPLKPGLVGPDSHGAHKDMDYALMLRSIAAIRPFFPRMALAGSAGELRRLGIEAEAAMLAATGGVNAHRGAIFALGLALFAAARTIVPADRFSEVAQTERLLQTALRETAQGIFENPLKGSEFQITVQSHGSVAREQYGAKGAREMALDGYRDLFVNWLPYFQSLKKGKGTLSSASLRDPVRANAPERAPSPFILQQVLMFILASLDDTCIIHRVGYERAQLVKEEAKALLREIPGHAGNDRGIVGNGEIVMADLTGHLKKLCDRYAAEGISPGGAADMLALTLFMDSILN